MSSRSYHCVPKATVFNKACFIETIKQNATTEKKINLTLENLAAISTVPSPDNYCHIVRLKPNCNIVKRRKKRHSQSL